MLRLLAVAFLALPAAAQAPVAWEAYPLPPDVIGPGRTIALGFVRGPVPDGSADTLFAATWHGVFRFDAAADVWANTCICSVFSFDVTGEGHLLAGAPAGVTTVDRSTDTGRTWEEDVFPDGASIVFASTLPTLGGAVYSDAGGHAYRSMSGGAAGTWVRLGSMGAEPAAMGEVPPSAPLPEGRLLAGVWGGASYSDDGGVTWSPSDLWGGSRHVPTSFAFRPEPGHPYGGATFAGVRDFADGESPGRVYRSEDGGATWALARAFGAGEFGLERTDWVEVAVTRDGSVWAGLYHATPGPPSGPGTIVRTVDRGQTWAAGAEGFGGWGVRELEPGRDGRLYAATEQGVWRTTAPIVAAEPGPEDWGSALSAVPNPAGGIATVRLVLPAPMRVRVTLLDVLGRDLFVLHDGPLAAGPHEFALNVTRLPRGLYVMRAAAGGWSAMTRLVVR